MKISKTKLRQIIKEELGTLREEDPAEETALNSPREAGRQWSYENIVNTVGDLVREALEGHDLDADSIRDAIAEALDEELGPVKDEGPRFTSTGPWAPEKRDIEEKFERRRYGKSAKKPEPKTPRDEKNLSQREKDALNSATGKKNQGRGGY